LTTYGTLSTPYLCVANCSFSKTFADNSTSKCVSQCPIGTFGDKTTYVCVSVCPTGTYG
jgi:hypothetical protein